MQQALTRQADIRLAKFLDNWTISRYELEPDRIVFYLWSGTAAGEKFSVRFTPFRTVQDLGCGEGKLLRLLVADGQFERILGMDVSWRAIEIASDRLKLVQMGEKQRSRIELMQGSLMYRDKRLQGFDAAAVIEVIEHLDPHRLAAFERVLFEFAKPRHIVVTTPNVEYNALFPTLPAGKLRHRDHRFEWTREQFRNWAERVAAAHGYSLRFQPVGPVDETHGAPTQMGIFSLA
jgi:3' terminal RNA ribose 2'-O-methyltransferase Hen1